ncbi:MAG: hypothetical protein ABSF98_07360 [Bryobacteraceae bacterium]
MRLLTVAIVAAAVCVGGVLWQRHPDSSDFYWRHFFPQYSRLAEDLNRMASFLVPLFVGLAACCATALLGFEVLFRRIRRLSVQAQAEVAERGTRMAGMADMIEKLRATDTKRGKEIAALQQRLDSLGQQVADSLEKPVESAPAPLGDGGIVWSIGDLTSAAQEADGGAFDPARMTHIEALEALHSGDLCEAATLLRRALQWARAEDAAAVSRAVIQYDLARVLAMQAESDAPNRATRLRLALSELQDCFSKGAVELDFKLLRDMEEGGAFHAMASTPPFDKAIDGLLLGIKLA